MSAPKPKVFISLDVEATGDAPSTSSCVMIGLCAVLSDVTPDEKHAANVKDGSWVVSSFQVCVEEQLGKPPQQRCWNEFWMKNLKVWQHIQDNKISPSLAMFQLSDWLRLLNKKYSVTHWIAKPASYDWQWLNSLYQEYGPANKTWLPFSCTCVSSMKKVIYDCISSIPEQEKSALSGQTHSNALPHTHFALEDAIQQAYEYSRLRKWITEHLFFKSTKAVTSLSTGPVGATCGADAPVKTADTKEAAH